MQIVIDIPESTYKVFKQLNKIIGVLVYEKDILTLIKAVKNGIPLPKGHGRLIDASLLEESLETAQVNLEDELSKAFDDGLTWASEVLSKEPTIVESESE